MLASGLGASPLNTIRRRSSSRHCPLVHRVLLHPSGPVWNTTLAIAATPRRSSRMATTSV
jgi:hypothetical protein